MTVTLIAEAAGEGFLVKARETTKGLFRNSIRDVPRVKWQAHELPATRDGRIALRNLLRDAAAEERDDGVLISAEGAAALDSREADALGLPPTLPLVLEVNTRDNIASDRFRVFAEFVDASGRAIAVKREGAVATVGDRTFRMPESFGSVLDGAEAINVAPDTDARLAAIAGLKAILQQTEGPKVDPFLKCMRLHHAQTMTLDVRKEDGAINFDPVLLSAWGEEAGAVQEPSQLLSDQEQRRFQEEFRRRGMKPAYVLASGEYVFVDKSLRRALEVVHKKQGAPVAERAQFALHPERVLADEGAILEPDEETSEPPRFVETPSYSERVLEIGDWVPPDLPFIKNAPNNWLTERFTSLLGDKLVTLAPTDVPGALNAVQTALANGAETAMVANVDVPATPKVLELLEALDAVASPPPRQDAGNDTADRGISSGNLDLLGAAREKQAPVILTNNHELDYRRLARERQTQEASLSLRSTLRPHQVVAHDWLRESYQRGRPGVLLADDMGLGKTIEVLSFLSWWRAATVKPRPILIVAPTSLLDNWQDEHDAHLATPLGEPLVAYGRGIRNLRTHDGKEEETGSSHLNIEAMSSKGFILTTYETLRDFAISFAAVPFGVAVFDETQKAKNPKSRLTNAVKSMNADFTIAMTGTPVENHMADLWSICDLVEPGVLGPLNDFVRRYDPSGDITPFEALRAELLEPDESGIPPLVLRRMKHDVINDLPELRQRALRRPMDGLQAQAYELAVRRAQAAGGVQKLRVLHDMRSISLHPKERNDTPDLSDDQFIAMSGRLAEAMKVLDAVKEEGAKALVFLEARRMQDVLSDLVAQRYTVRWPDIISGGTKASQRQRIVDDFCDLKGFAVLILSPRAAGVGLNITAATHVIHLDRWWNPAVEDQCTARAYRIGQSKAVTVHLPMAVHPGFADASYDEVLHGILERKRKTSELFMPTEISADDFEPEDKGDKEFLDGFAEEAAGFSAGLSFLDKIDRGSGLAFEDWTVQQLKKTGIRAERTKASGDGGVDVVVRDQTGCITHLIQCKQTGDPSKGIGKEILSDEASARHRWSAPYAKFVAVTNAKNFAPFVADILRERNAILVTRKDLKDISNLFRN